ncbi:MAG: ABC transporter permease, partial [Corynebacterium nuruki]|nr:ABC transporter permease [Corynebacterium nuruki]
DSVVSERAEHHGGTAVAAAGQLLSDGDRTPPTGLDSTQSDFHDLEAEVAAEEAGEGAGKPADEASRRDR